MKPFAIQQLAIFPKPNNVLFSNPRLALTLSPIYVNSFTASTSWWLFFFLHSLRNIPFTLPASNISLHPWDHSFHSGSFFSLRIILFTPDHSFHSGTFNQDPLVHCMHITQLTFDLKLQTPHGETTFGHATLRDAALTIALIILRLTYKTLALKSLLFSELMSESIVLHIRTISSGYNNSFSSPALAKSTTTA